MHDFSARFGPIKCWKEKHSCFMPILRWSLLIVIRSHPRPRDVSILHTGVARGENTRFGKLSIQQYFPNPSGNKRTHTGLLTLQGTVSSPFDIPACITLHVSIATAFVTASLPNAHDINNMHCIAIKSNINLYSGLLVRIPSIFWVNTLNCMSEVTTVATAVLSVVLCVRLVMVRGS